MLSSVHRNIKVDQREKQTSKLLLQYNRVVGYLGINFYILKIKNIFLTCAQFPGVDVGVTMVVDGCDCEQGVITFLSVEHHNCPQIRKE